MERKPIRVESGNARQTGRTVKWGGATDDMTVYFQFTRSPELSRYVRALALRRTHQQQPETPNPWMRGANGRRVSRGRFRVGGYRAFWPEIMDLPPTKPWKCRCSIQSCGRSLLSRKSRVGVSSIGCNRPRTAERMQLLAMAMARWVPPVPVRGVQEALLISPRCFDRRRMNGC